MFTVFDKPYKYNISWYNYTYLIFVLNKKLNFSKFEVNSVIEFCQ